MVPTRFEQVSPRFTPRPSLSVRPAEHLGPGDPGVAEVHASAFVERTQTPLPLRH